MKQGFPSKDPARLGGLPGALREILGKFLQSVDDMLPAKVISYDRMKNTASVQPLIAVMTTNGDAVSRAVIASVPVFSFGGGNFMINFPLKKGDLGWIKASDRDISLFVQSLKESKPNTVRKHSFEDGIFFPDAFRNYTLSDEDAENLVIQTLDSKTRISLWSDRVKIVSGPTSCEVNSNGTITAVAPTSVFFDTPLVEFAGIFKGGTKYPGGLSEVAGTLKADDVISSGVSGKSHIHGGVQPGSGQSGPPTGGG